MSKIRPIFYATRSMKDNPKITFDSGEKEKLDIWLDTFSSGTELILEVYERKYQRTHPQNDYYWGVVVKLLAETFGWEDETMHDFLKSRYLSKKIDWKGKEVWITGSTARLKIDEFAQYLDKCILFAAENDVIIPEASKIEIQ